MITEARIDSTAVPRTRLTRWLTVDGAVTGLNAIGYLVLAGQLTTPLGSEAGVLRGLGVFLLAFTLLVVVAAVSRSTALAAVVVATNLAWALASVVVAATGLLDLTVIGRVWALLQAGVVGAFGFLQLRALRTVTRKGNRA